MAEQSKPGYYAIIPAEVRYDARLTASAKLLYGEIAALCSSSGTCWASNEYFAKLYGLSKKRITELITGLEKCQYISIKMEFRDKSKQVEKRIIAINFKLDNRLVPPHENVGTPPQKCGYPPHENVGTSPRKCGYPPHENVGDNNTSINNTRTPIAPRDILERVKQYASHNQELQEAFFSFLENRTGMHKQVRSQRALTNILRHLDNLSGGNECLKIKLLDEATTHSWLNVYETKETKSLATAAVKETEEIMQW